MKRINGLIILTLAMVLSGCAAKMAYLNTQKPFEVVKSDKADCQSVVDASDLKDNDLKKKKFDQCMKDKGYNVVSEAKAEKIQGFKGLWIKPQADFKVYEAIFIDQVDLSLVKINNTSIPNGKTTDEDIDNLGDEMLKRFSNDLSIVLPVILDRKEAAGKKVLCLSLKLVNISQTNIGINAALQVAGHFTPVPLPEGPKGIFSFEAVVTDFSNKEELITIIDEVKENKNASLAGLENFEKWKHAYNVLDYWADHLAALLAKERGIAYKTRLGFKLIDF